MLYITYFYKIQQIKCYLSQTKILPKKNLKKEHQ